MQASMNVSGRFTSKLVMCRSAAHRLPMITVANCNSPMHAQLLKSVLEDSGIPAVIPNENSAQIMPHLILAMGGIHVQVPEEHEAAARKLVADFDAATPGSDTFPPAVC
jgi:hypothetical protein